MRMSLVLMICSAVGMLVAALVGYSRLGDSENVAGGSMIFLVFCGMVFFAGWLLLLQEFRRRSAAVSSSSKSGEKK